MSVKSGRLELIVIVEQQVDKVEVVVVEAVVVVVIVVEVVVVVIVVVVMVVDITLETEEYNQLNQQIFDEYTFRKAFDIKILKPSTPSIPA